MSLSKEEKKNISKIKKLIRSRNFTNIETGIELVRSLNNPNIFDELLGDVKYKSDKWSGTFTHDWKGNGPDQHYFLTSILGLINFAPKGSKGYSIRESVTILKLKGEVNSGYSHENSVLYIGYLSNFLNLKYLKFERYKEVVGFENIYDLPIEGLEIKYGETLPKHKEKWSFKKLKTLHLELPTKEDIAQLDFLSEATSVENLKITGGSGKKGFSIEALNYLENLRYLNTSRLGYCNLDGINKLKKLNYIKLSSENHLEDVLGLASSDSLEFIDLSYCEVLSDVTALKKFKNIKFVDFSSTSLKSLSGLENSINLLAVKIARTPIENLDALMNLKKLHAVDAHQCKQLNSIKGLKHSLNLREILLHDSNKYSYNYETGKDQLSKEGSLKTLEGIENCLELRTITLSKTAITNLDSLIKCRKIFRNNSSKWDEEALEWNGGEKAVPVNDPFWGITEEVRKVGGGNLYNAAHVGNNVRDYYKNRDWSEPELNEFSIIGCPNLESVEGLKNSGIQLLQVSGCPMIKNVDYLSDWPLLQCCDFTNCNNLESVKVLASLNLMDRLILKKCYKVRPKPRFLIMDSLEKTIGYLSKFKANEKKINLSAEDKSISEKLEKLLFSNNYKDVDLGLELANSISDIDVFNFLLEGVKYINGKTIPNNRFLGNSKTQELKTYALEGIISIAPDSCKIASEIKKDVKEKWLEGDKITSLLSVSGFTSLEILNVRDTSITVASDISRLINLKKIRFINCPELSDLSDLKNLSNLEFVGLKDCLKLKDLSFLSNLTNLKAVFANACGVVSTKGVFGLPLLKNINLNNNSNLENIDELGNISSLNTVTITGCSSLKNIKGLTKLSNLSFLRLDKHDLENTEDISSLIKPLLEGLRK